MKREEEANKEKPMIAHIPTLRVSRPLGRKSR
jgi:hypothetical protein